VANIIVLYVVAFSNWKAHPAMVRSAGPGY
jgi:hypothetical protein